MTPAILEINTRDRKGNTVGHCRKFTYIVFCLLLLENEEPIEMVSQSKLIIYLCLCLTKFIALCFFINLSPAAVCRFPVLRRRPDKARYAVCSYDLDMDDHSM